MNTEYFFRPTEFTANRYYEICTSDRFRDLSGVHLNHELVVMQPAQVGKGIITDIKQAFGADVYPVYAQNREMVNKVWNVCNEKFSRIYPVIHSPIPFNWTLAMASPYHFVKFVFAAIFA